MEDLCSLLLRFRTYETAIVADIEKGFLQINLQEQDRDVTRFLWLKDINKSVIPSNIDVFRFTRIPFGIISRQFILAATIVYHLQSKKGPIAKQLMKNLYMGNLITGTNSKDAELQIYEQGKQLFREMSMNLREWGSNSQTLRNSFKKEDRFDGKEMNVLGIIWNMNDDCIYTPVKESYKPEIFTNRQILKRYASIFDPLGFFNQSLLKANYYYATYGKWILNGINQSNINLLIDGKKSMRICMPSKKRSFQDLLETKRLNFYAFAMLPARHTE